MIPQSLGRAHPTAETHQWARIEPDRDITVVDHIPTLNKAATLCALGPYVDAATLERCVDEFLRTDSHRWLADTMDRLGTHRPNSVGSS